MPHNRYEQLEEIGRGGMGTVFKGRDLENDQLVAIKRLKKDELATDKNALQRFQREGEILQELHHPNIIRVLDVDFATDSPMIVMEYVSGGSLADYILENGPLPIDLGLRIGLEVADALTRAHHLNILHRDLKPANVLLREDLTPCLTDFGLAYIKGDEHLTQSSQLIGTVPYMSPEALNNQELDQKTDIWAFGVMLYEILTGTHPFRGATLGSLMKAILTDQPRPELESIRPDLPVGLIDLIQRMLVKDVYSRIPRMRLIGAELEAIYDEDWAEQPTGVRTDFEGPTARFAIPVPPSSASNNLPADLTPFIGRERELETLNKVISQPDNRLITILAAGGMGKTRLAVEAAHQQIADWRDGVYMVDLAPLTSPDEIPTAVADALNFQFYPGPPQHEQILNFLRSREMLLIMDNCEHILSGVGFIDEMLHSSPDISILATSRERLNLRGETVFTIEGMDVPESGNVEQVLACSAARLFVQSARRADYGFELHPDETAAVVRICRIVEGMPLGIVLAAGWNDTLSVAEIADEIESNADFLESTRRDVPDRQRSIQAVFDYSWSLLEISEQTVFTKLAAFQGGFTRQAAQDIAGATLRNLQTLVQKSLLLRDSASGRYRMHELLRQYAARILEQSDSLDSIQDQHSAYYLDFLSSQSSGLYGPNEAAVNRLIGIEFENIQKAWYHKLRAQKADDALQIYRGWGEYLNVNERLEDLERVQRETLSILGEHPSAPEFQALKALISVLQSRIALFAGEVGLDDFELVIRTNMPVLETFGAWWPMMRVLSGLELIAQKRGELETSQRYLEEMLHLTQQHNDLDEQFQTLHELAWNAYRSRNIVLAQSYVDQQKDLAAKARSAILAQKADFQSLVMMTEQQSVQAWKDFIETHRQTMNKRMLILSLSNLGWNQFELKQFSEARDSLLEAQAYTEELGLQSLSIRINLGWVEQASGNFPAAKGYVGSVIKDLSSQWDYAYGNEILILSATILIDSAAEDRAIELLGLYSTRDAVDPLVHDIADSLQQELQERAESERFREAFERGRSLDIQVELGKILKEWERQ